MVGISRLKKRKATDYRKPIEFKAEETELTICLGNKLERKGFP